MRDEGARGAALALEQIDRIDEYLSACQLGITMASLGIGFLGEPAIASLLEEPLGDVAAPRRRAGHRADDRLPDHDRAAHHASASRCRRSTRSSHAESTALRGRAAARAGSASPSSPLIWALNSASNAMLRVVGVDPRAEFEEVSSPRTSSC